MGFGWGWFEGEVYELVECLVVWRGHLWVLVVGLLVCCFELYHGGNSLCWLGFVSLRPFGGYMYFLGELVYVGFVLIG